MEQRYISLSLSLFHTHFETQHTQQQRAHAINGLEKPPESTHKYT